MTGTPGPWDYQRSHSDSCQFEVFSQEGEVAGEYGVSDEEDARLIAAAPELLEALKYARRFLRGLDHDVDYVDAVIAKAEVRKRAAEAAEVA